MSPPRRPPQLTAYGLLAYGRYRWTARLMSEGTVRAPLNVDDLLALPPVIDVPTAAAVLGIGRTSAYELIRSGSWPTPVLHLGKSIRVPTAALLKLVQGQA